MNKASLHFSYDTAEFKANPFVCESVSAGHVTVCECYHDVVAVLSDP